MIAVASPALYSAAHLVTVRVIQSLVEGSLIGLFATAVLRLFRQNARTRFAVWFSSLLAIAALPLVRGEWLWHVSSGSQIHAVITLRDSWALGIFVIWAVVGGWLLLGVARSVWYLRILRRSCVEVDPTALAPKVQETIRRQQQIRMVTLCTSATIRIPTAIGFLKPTVVIPEWVMQELSSDEMNQILLHEFAHLCRWDDWTNLAVQVVKAVFFFHPAVWWMERESALEREMACDDAVLAQTENSHAYADCLTHLAEKTLLQRTVVLAHAALGRIRQTTKRITRILDANGREPQARALKPVASLIVVFAVGCGVWTSHISGLIAFEGSPTGANAGTSATFSPSLAVNGMNARVVPAMARSSQAIETRQTKLISPAKLKTRSLAARREVRSVIGSAALVAGRHQFMLTSFRAMPLPITETVFVLIPNPDPDSEAGQLYEIQMWHVVVLRSVVSPGATQISHKET